MKEGRHFAQGFAASFAWRLRWQARGSSAALRGGGCVGERLVCVFWAAVAAAAAASSAWLQKRLHIEYRVPWYPGPCAVVGAGVGGVDFASLVDAGVEIQRHIVARDGVSTSQCVSCRRQESVRYAYADYGCIFCVICTAIDFDSSSA